MTSEESVAFLKTMQAKIEAMTQEDFSKKLKEIRPFSDDTFASSKEYKTVPFILDSMTMMDEKERRHLFRFFHKLNINCLQLARLRDLNAMFTRIAGNTKRKYFMFDVDLFYGLLRKEYMEKMNKELKLKCGSKLYSYIQNYVVTKIKKSAGLIE